MKFKGYNIFLIIFAFFMCFGLFGCDLSNPSLKTTQQVALESLVKDIEELENISKSYNENKFSERTLIYVRSKKYNDDSWNTLAGALEEDFENYVEIHQGEKNLSYLQTKDFFADTATIQNIDFVHLFATMNMELKGTTLGDLGGYGGDICQLVKELKDLNIQDTQLLEQTAKNKFNGQSSFGSEDLLADIDAVNVINIYNNSTENAKTIANCMLTYYTNLQQEQRLNLFCENLFGAKLNSTLSEKCDYLYTRLKNNYLLSYLCDDRYGINFNTNRQEFEICIRLFVEYISSIN